MVHFVRSRRRTAWAALLSGAALAASAGDGAAESGGVRGQVAQNQLAQNQLAQNQAAEAAPLIARAEVLSCSSMGYEHARCPHDLTDRDLVLSEILSSGVECRQGVDWGYDAQGIWVDNGCRAVFTVVDAAARKRD